MTRRYGQSGTAQQLASATLLMLLLTMPSIAAAAEAEGAKSGSLPQFDVTRFPEQLFWFFVSFGLLYWLVSRFVMPPLTGTLGKRHNLIDTDLAEANRMAETAKATRASYEEALLKARNEAAATVSGIIATAAEQTSAQQAAQEASLKKRQAEAESRIRATRDKALKEIHGSARELAELVVHKASGVKTTIAGG